MYVHVHVTQEMRRTSCYAGIITTYVNSDPQCINQAIFL